jgi:hypothetical protein
MMNASLDDFRNPDRLPILDKALTHEADDSGFCRSNTSDPEARAPMAKDSIPTSETARLLGVSKQRVEQLRKAGKLGSATLDPNGRWQFDRAEVQRLLSERARAPHPRMLDGKRYAQVFVMFQRGLSFADIVVQAQVTPEQVRALYNEYLQPLAPRAAGGQ